MKHGHTQHFQQFMARLVRPEPVEGQQHSRQLMCKALHTPGIGHAARDDALHPCRHGRYHCFVTQAAAYRRDRCMALCIPATTRSSNASSALL